MCQSLNPFFSSTQRLCLSDLFSIRGGLSLDQLSGFSLSSRFKLFGMSLTFLWYLVPLSFDVFIVRRLHTSSRNLPKAVSSLEKVGEV